MNSIIIGTSGHIDHGKTALIRALNGFEGDRNIEEKERGITIDLSFSNLSANGKNIAFIDVPGHENLIKTMISGAYAFDYAMVVVASDDGLMPQSKEHIEILSILDVKNIILSITKCDLVSKERQIEVKNECFEFINQFKNLSILQTFFLSIKDENSIKELKDYLFLLEPKKRYSGGIMRYYIDRVFSLKGIGTVVTGSLTEGNIKKGDKIYNCDLDKIYNVRSVQIHDHFSDSATSPNRVALNLSEGDVSRLKKGQILTKKGIFRGFLEADCLFYGKILHNEDVVFCVGSKQSSAKCIILSENDEQKLLTFKFEKPMFLKFDEAYVVLANSRVIGGGKVLNPLQEPLKKPSKIKLLKALLDRNLKSAFEILISTHKHGFGLISSYQRFNIDHQEAIEVAKSIKNCFLDENNLCLYSLSAIDDIKEFIKFVISKNPQAIFSAQSISLKITWASEIIAQMALSELQTIGLIIKNNGLYIKKGGDFSKIQENITEKIYKILQNGGISPLAPYNIYDEIEIDRQSGDNALKSLTKSKKVIRLAHNLFITTQNLNNAMDRLRAIIKRDGNVNVANAKNELGLSRKFAISYLEYLDNFEDIAKVDNNRIFKTNIYNS